MRGELLRTECPLHPGIKTRLAWVCPVVSKAAPLGAVVRFTQNGVASVMPISRRLTWWYGSLLRNATEVRLKYDDASWHYGGDFPPELPPQAGATHTGMFSAWAVLSGLVRDLHKEHSNDLLTRLEQRTISPGQFFIEACDEKFTDEDLNDAGNAFTQEYYEFETGNYLADYERVLGPDVPTLYH